MPAVPNKEFGKLSIHSSEQSKRVHLTLRGKDKGQGKGKRHPEAVFSPRGGRRRLSDAEGSSLL